MVRHAQQSRVVDLGLGLERAHPPTGLHVVCVAAHIVKEILIEGERVSVDFVRAADSRPTLTPQEVVRDAVGQRALRGYLAGAVGAFALHRHRAIRPAVRRRSAQYCVGHTSYPPAACCTKRTASAKARISSTRCSFAKFR